MKKWKELYDSKSGEPGFFSRYACQRIAARNGRRDPSFEFGTNPCSEIILRPFQFCNLTEIVVRADDTLESLKRKAEIASILGTIQSTFTNFKYLRKVWKDNCEEERLLGVSLTGVMDNLKILTKENLNEIRDVVIQTNKEWAERLDISVSTATTCVKPSGTVSQLVNSASGLHTRHSPYYIRTVRGDNKDPLTEFLKSQGVPNEPAFGKEDSTTVFSFPVRSPKGAKTRHDQTALEALEVWKLIQDEWCEHKPSVTISVKEDEWLAVGAWVYNNFDTMSGISFLPYDNGTYRQAPYTECSKEEYEEALKKMPKSISWESLQTFEREDTTTGSQELACSGSGVCEIVSIGSVKDD